MEIVKNSLQNLYELEGLTDSIKQQIEQFFAGNLDVSHIIEQRKRQNKWKKDLKN